MKAMFSMYEDISDYTTAASAPRTLSDWVKNFRLKKIQMKRKLRSGGGDLRMCAIMATALLSAENQLRTKQKERLSRCLDFKSKFHHNGGGMIVPLSSSATATSLPTSAEDIVMQEEEDQKRRIEICNIWREELNGLDEFMRKMSSNSCNNHHHSNMVANKNQTCRESAYRNETNSSIAVSS